MREINEHRLAVYLDIIGLWRQAIHAGEKERAARLFIAAEILEEAFPAMKELCDMRYPHERTIAQPSDENAS